MEDQELAPDGQSSPPEQEASRLPRFRIGAAVALAAAAGLAAWFVVDSRDDGSSPKGTSTTATTATAPATVNPIGPVGLSAKGLQTLIGTVGAPVYWAGPETGKLYELTRTNAGKVFVRYLPSGVKVGTKQSTYLIVATYPFRNAYKALEQLQGSKRVTIPGGGIAVVDQAHPESVHVAFPGVDEQVEVFDPSPARSLQIARSGAVKPVA